MPPRNFALAGAPLLLAACAATSGSGPDPAAVDGEEIATRPQADACQAEPGQPLVGERASPEIGAAILQATGARTLRWAPPDSALTMDYRVDRVTVSYDRDYRITQVSCG